MNTDIDPEGKVTMSLENYHKLYQRLKERREELERATRDSEEVINEFNRVNRAADAVGEFLTMLYQKHSELVEKEVKIFNKHGGEGIIVLDKENKKVTVSVDDQQE